jgi:hypothetical protein
MEAPSEAAIRIHLRQQSIDRKSVV